MSPGLLLTGTPAAGTGRSTPDAAGNTAAAGAAAFAAAIQTITAGQSAPAAGSAGTTAAAGSAADLAGTTAAAESDGTTPAAEPATADTGATDPGASALHPPLLQAVPGPVPAPVPVPALPDGTADAQAVAGEEPAVEDVAGMKEAGMKEAGTKAAGNEEAGKERPAAAPPGAISASPVPPALNPDAGLAAGTDAGTRTAPLPAQGVSGAPGAPAAQGAPIQLPAATQAAPASSPLPAPAAAHPVQLLDQVSQPLVRLSAAAPGEHLITLSVDPENLGPVTVRAYIGADGVRVEMFAPNDAGREALRLILADLRRDLAGGGAGSGATLSLSDQNQPGNPSGGDSAQTDARNNRQRAAAFSGPAAVAADPGTPQTVFSRFGFPGSSPALDVMA